MQYGLTSIKERRRRDIKKKIEYIQHLSLIRSLLYKNLYKTNMNYLSLISPLMKIMKIRAQWVKTFLSTRWMLLIFETNNSDIWKNQRIKELFFEGVNKLWACINTCDIILNTSSLNYHSLIFLISFSIYDYLKINFSFWFHNLSNSLL